MGQEEEEVDQDDRINQRAGARRDEMVTGGALVENTALAGNGETNVVSIPGSSASSCGTVQETAPETPEEIAAKLRKECCINDEDSENSNDGMDISNVEGLNKRSREGSPIQSKPDKKRKEDGNESDDTLTPSGEEDEEERENRVFLIFHFL